MSGRSVPGPSDMGSGMPVGAALFQRDNGSVIELVRFALHSFELDHEGVAALFGLELARLVRDTLDCELMGKRDTSGQGPRRPFLVVSADSKAD